MRIASDKTRAFTLIELSIVLVIIGLIVGGVLVGQDLIRAAYIRAQISQIEKFNTAKNTFYGKYQGLPGDITNTTAMAFGFSAATHNGNGGIGQGDGNGILDGCTGNGVGTMGSFQVIEGFAISCGEVAVFWVDLSSANAGNLIEGGFNTAVESSTGIPNVSSVQLPLWLPPAKLGGGNYVAIMNLNGLNYYAIAAAQNFTPTLNAAVGMTVIQAYNIDRKVDDGLPTTGNVSAMLLTGIPVWAIGGAVGINGVIPSVSESYTPVNDMFSGTAATAGTATGSTTCFDAPTVGSHPTYSTEINGGAGLNCALIFKFQ